MAKVTKSIKYSFVSLVKLPESYRSCEIYQERIKLIIVKCSQIRTSTTKRVLGGVVPLGGLSGYIKNIASEDGIYTWLETEFAVSWRSFLLLLRIPLNRPGVELC